MLRPILAAVLALTLAGGCGGARAAPVSLQEFQARSSIADSAPTRTVHFGDTPYQTGDLWLPEGAGPFPVVILIHGGCWTSRFGGRAQMNAAAADLRGRGIAVWNIDYRRIEEPGGAYPGTFQDVAAGVDAVRILSDRLDLDRVVIAGHSAGGHLAAWAAGRARLPAASVLHASHPLEVRGVLALGPALDLEKLQPSGAVICSAEGIRTLVGQPGPDRPDVYADTSPAALLPLGVRQTILVGEADPLAPSARAYVAEARAKGDWATAVVVPDAGHFDVVAPWTPAWKETVQQIEVLLAR